MKELVLKALKFIKGLGLKAEVAPFWSGAGRPRVCIVLVDMTWLEFMKGEEEVKNE